MDTPPGGTAFQDVTYVFEKGAEALAPGSSIMMNGYGLQDAMGALEIGEPRMDSGVASEEDKGRPSFDALTPLLPEELCWILDRMFACEMQWHAGNSLSQTIYTLLYVHHLVDINPEFFPSLGIFLGDARRPAELITVVLRANVLGLLKCCDMAWREMSRNNLYDGEDWHSDKCDISVLEQIDPSAIIKLLDETLVWLSSSRKVVNSSWNDALIKRTSFRKTMLQTISSPTHQLIHSQPYIIHARLLLDGIRSGPSPSLSSDSLVPFVFDPAINRRLNSFVPLRVLPPMPREEAWEILDHLLSGWLEVLRLSEVKSIADWETLGHLRTWSPKPWGRLPYIRSLTQSMFSDGNSVLNQLPHSCVVEGFFFDTCGLQYNYFRLVVNARWVGKGVPPLLEFEHRIAKLVIPHVWALWQNQPRQRRHFKNDLLDWHLLYHDLLALASQISPKAQSERDMITCATLAPLLWRLTAIREVVFSGFQLELYSDEERPFAYWYAAYVIDAHLSCLGVIMDITQTGSPLYDYFDDQFRFLTGLQAMSTALFLMTARTMRLSEERMRLNFLRRYKWAVKPEYTQIATPVIAPPDFDKFLTSRSETLDVLEEDPHLPAAYLDFAKSILVSVNGQSPNSSWESLSTHDLLRFVIDLVAICDNLSATLRPSNDSCNKVEYTLAWDAQENPWFPRAIS